MNSGSILRLMTEVLDGICKIAEKMGLKDLNYSPSVVLSNVPLWILPDSVSKTVICSDSAAALRGLSSKQTVREDLMIEIHVMLLRLQKMSIEVQFCCAPAHMGVKSLINH